MKFNLLSGVLLFSVLGVILPVEAHYSTEAHEHRRWENNPRLWDNNPRLWKNNPRRWENNPRLWKNNDRLWENQ